MKRNIGIACGSAILLLGMAVSAAGCGKQTNQNANGVRTQSVQDNRIKNANPNEVAEHLERLATGVPGVKGADCVVFGKYAVVGIDVDEKMERSEVGTLKYAVAEAFRKDPYGIDAVVTADMDIRQRLREIGTDIRNGRPIAGFAEEMSDIIGRVIPQIPRNIIPPKQPENYGTDDVNTLKH